MARDTLTLDLGDNEEMVAKFNDFEVGDEGTLSITYKVSAKDEEFIQFSVVDANPGSVSKKDSDREEGIPPEPVDNPVTSLFS